MGILKKCIRIQFLIPCFFCRRYSFVGWLDTLNMSVTQKDIATKLNISQAHVARALSGSTLVSTKTRLRIEQVARDMGYDAGANSAARSMIARRHGKSLKKGTIAMIFQSLGAPLRVLPFYEPFMEGIEEATTVNNTDLCLSLLRLPVLPRLIRDRNVDGVIVMGDFPQLSAEIQSLGLPVVTFHTCFKGISSVRPDDADGARQATQYLFEQGHRRIGYIGTFSSYINEESDPGVARYQGYLEAMAEYGLASRDEWAVTQFGNPEPTADTYCNAKGHCNRCAACCSWDYLMQKNRDQGTLDEFPTAFVCHNDMIAMGLTENAGRDGVVVPRDLSVIGFDDMSVQYHFEPSLTSVSLPLREMGRNAVQLLSEMEPEADNQEAIDSVFPVSLVVRESTRSIEACVPA